jgi:hypothetical protein
MNISSIFVCLFCNEFALCSRIGIGCIEAQIGRFFGYFEPFISCGMHTPSPESPHPQRIVNHIRQGKAQPTALPSVVRGCYDETKLHVLYEQSLYCPDLQPKGN